MTGQRVALALAIALFLGAGCFSQSGFVMHDTVARVKFFGGWNETAASDAGNQSGFHMAFHNSNGGSAGSNMSVWLNLFAPGTIWFMEPGEWWFELSFPANDTVVYHNEYDEFMASQRALHENRAIEVLAIFEAHMGVAHNDTWI